jgi:predicted esterase
MATAVSRIFKFTVALLLILAVPGILTADIVYLNTGGKVEGRIIERTIDGVRIRTVKGVTDIPADDIDRIEERESIFDRYDEKLKETPEDNTDARFELGLWCKDNGLIEEAKKHFEEVIALSPDHEKARAQLGYVKTADGWEIPPPPKEEVASAEKPEPEPDPAVVKGAPAPAEKPKEPEKKPGKTYPKREPGISRESITYKGKELPLVLRVPGKYTGEDACPFVILLHGAGDTADNFMRCISSLVKHDDEDLIMVAPENATLPRDAVIELIKKYIHDFNIDKKRLYMFGFSMGGWHTSTVAPRLPKVFASFVIAGAGNKQGCPRAEKGYPSAGILIGKSDPNYKPSVTAYEQYKRNGWDTKFWEFDGGHVLPGPELMNEVFDWMLSKKKGK